MIFNQQEFDIRMEWGLRGVEELAPISDVLIIVDVLSFSTCVDIATGNGAFIYPYRFKDEAAHNYATAIGAQLAVSRQECAMGYSLSPVSLLGITAGTKLVLPSPNGATLTLATGQALTIAGCLRNAKAVAEYAIKVGKSISVIPAGEKWSNGSLRVAYEDLLGAGAIISFLTGSLSPESKLALAAYNSVSHQFLTEIKNCGSGKELIAMGFESDVDLACQLNISTRVPVFKNGCYVSCKL